jgi:hypothetical protein
MTGGTARQEILPFSHFRTTSFRALRLRMEVMIERFLRFELPGKEGGIPSGDGKGVLLTYSTERSRKMPKIEDLGEVVSTDLLIIGGGLAGLVAAIEAKEYPVDVLLVDKQTIGWSGKAPKVGGGLWVMLPDDDVNRFTGSP